MRALSSTSGEAVPNKRFNIGVCKPIRSRPIPKAISDTEATEAAVAWDTIRSFPLPLYCATTTVPPVATATNTLIRKIFSESTIFTALTAAIPDELIIAVFTRLSPIMKA
ncbi:hypothetical protein D3C76_1065130 [compost metagenome]